MTEKQRHGFYFPLWNQVVQAHDWRMERGRLAAAPLEHFADAEANTLYLAVWQAADARALVRDRAIAPDDLRHACHIVALGYDISSRDLDNLELDRVTTAFRILADPHDVQARMDWSHPENQARRRLVYSITHAAPDAYVRDIAGDRFGTRLWENLEMPDLRWLVWTIHQRRKSWQRRRHDKTHAAAECPF